MERNSLPRQFPSLRGSAPPHDDGGRLAATPGADASSPTPPPTFCPSMQAARPRIRPCGRKPCATDLCATRADLQNVLQSAARDATRPAERAMRGKAATGDVSV